MSEMAMFQQPARHRQASALHMKSHFCSCRKTGDLMVQVSKKRNVIVDVRDVRVIGITALSENQWGAKPNTLTRIRRQTPHNSRQLIGFGEPFFSLLWSSGQLPKLSLGVSDSLQLSTCHVED